MANNVDLVMRLLAEDKASAAFKKVGSEAGRTGKSYQKFGDVARNALLAVGVTAFAASSVKAFAEVQDASSALTATYGDTGQAFIDWANNSADAMNLSKREALAASQSFALFGKAAGLTGKQLEQYVTPLVERAADAASYFGGTAADAVEAFSAALRGEMEPARKYGVLLDDMTLRTKALSMGLIDNVKTALTPQQKALTAQQLILEQTAQVQGDVARTSDSMANKIKDASQQFDDLKVSVGETLSVAVGPMLSGLNATVGAFNKLPQPVKSVAVAVTVAGAAFLYLAPKIAAAKLAIGQLGVTSFTASGKVGKFGKALGVVTAALSIASVANNTMTESTTDVDAALSLLAGNHATDQIGTDLAHLFGATTKMDAARDALAGVDSQLTEMVSKGQATAAAAQFEEMRRKFADAGGEMSIFDKAFAGYTKATQDATSTTGKFAEATADVTKETRSAAWAVDYYKKRLDVLNNKNLDARQRAIAWKDSLVDLSEQVKENGRSLDENTTKGRKNVSALLERIQATNDDAAANLDAGASYDVVKGKHDKQIADLRALAIKLGLNKGAVDALIKSYGLMPAKVTTVVVANGAKTVLATLAAINAELRKMPGHSGVAVAVTSDGDVSVGHGTSGKSSTRSVVPSRTTSSASSAGNAQVNVYLEGKHVQTSLVSLQRQQGGKLAFLN